MVLSISGNSHEHSRKVDSENYTTMFGTLQHRIFLPSLGPILHSQEISLILGYASRKTGSWYESSNAFTYVRYSPNYLPCPQNMRGKRFYQIHTKRSCHIGYVSSKFINWRQTHLHWSIFPYSFRKASWKLTEVSYRRIGYKPKKHQTKKSRIQCNLPSEKLHFML